MTEMVLRGVFHAAFEEAPACYMQVAMRTCMRRRHTFPPASTAPVKGVVDRERAFPPTLEAVGATPDGSSGKLWCGTHHIALPPPWRCSTLEKRWVYPDRLVWEADVLLRRGT